MNQLFVNEVLVSQFLDVMIHIYLGVILLEPVFTIVCFLLIEGEVYCFVIICAIVLKANPMIRDCPKVLFGFQTGRSSQTFVVLDLETLDVLLLLSPPFVLWDCEEGMTIIVSGCLYDRCDELLQESVVPCNEIWPVPMKEVDEESLDMRSIVILICHDHY